MDRALTKDLEDIITYSGGGLKFSSVLEEKQVKKNKNKKKKTVEEITDEAVIIALSNKFNQVANELGLSENGIKAGNNIISAVISGNKTLKLRPSYEDTVESAMVKIGIQESLKKHWKKKSKSISDDDNEFSDNEISNINDSVDKVSTEALNKKIADNVASATSDFIQDRTDRMNIVKEAYKKTIEKKNNIKNAESEEEKEDAEKEAQEAAFQLQVTKDRLEERPVSLFESIVVSVAENYNDESNKSYIESSNGSIDMEKVMDISSGIYAALETVNQYNFIDFTEKDIDTIINTI